MTPLFQQLRTRSRALAQGLMLVLLATWLSALCAQCLDPAGRPGAAPVSATSTPHCHADLPPPGAQSDAHDCCTQARVVPGGDCAQLTAIESAAPLGVLLPEASSPACVAAGFIGVAYPSTPPPAAPAAHTATFDPCPLYLRHCTFLN